MSVLEILTLINVLINIVSLASNNKNKKSPPSYQDVTVIFITIHRGKTAKP